MDVSFTAPLGQAWARTRSILFSPFDLGKWLGLGFAAWIAGMGEGSGFGGGTNLSFDKSDIQFERLFDHFSTTTEKILASGLLISLVVLGCLVLLAVLIGLLWLSSRFKFVFLEDVLQNRGRIAEPWKNHAALGQSLFWWRLVFSGAVFVVMMTLAALTLLLALPLGKGGAHGELIAVLGVAGLLALGILLSSCFVDFLLEGFVVPVMYRDRLGATDAWRRFLPLFRVHLAEFVLFALFVALLYVGVTVAVILTGLLTCCVGFLILAIPYVGTILQLPILVTYRLFTVDFLAQFGPEFTMPETAGETPGGPLPPPEGGPAPA